MGRSHKLQPRERDIQRAICRYLTLQRIPFAVTDAALVMTANGARRRVSRSGWPDITACVRGRLWAIEVKRPSGRLRPAQAEMLRRLVEAGAYVTVARDVEDVIHAHERIQRGLPLR